ncbi:MAG: efflux RND transporter permease subunit [Acidobacteria bacterium]|nr:efflux RND transporter permease subunit [Acidobacteriota bacterium]
MRKNEPQIQPKTLLEKLTLFSLQNRMLFFLLLIFIIIWGIIVAPFDWDISFLHRTPVAVDAIPDISENQQIVFTPWEGRSPQDVQDQVTYPLTVSLLGIQGIRTVRSNSMMGFSSIYLIFNEEIGFYASRSRILEKLNSLPPGTLPDGVKPSLGPDATALGQIFWYTLEGRDKEQNPASGWSLQELRTIQDWYIRYALASAEGVSEVASIGGFVKEFQVDIDPDKMRAAGISLQQVLNAVKSSNREVGARTIEINNVEYLIRGIGFIKNTEDLVKAVVTVNDNIPVTLHEIANITTGPALRRGILDKGGAEAVGGVVVARFGENPLEVINNVKKKIAEISSGLPEKELGDGSISKVTIVPFYDRTELIYQTLGTLNEALSQEILVTVIVILLLLMHIRSSLLISALLPVAVLMSFIFMKIFGVDANIVALSGIAIAIGTMVDMGIVISENIIERHEKKGAGKSWLSIVYESTSEVGGAIITAVLTTIVGFLPVFAMTGAEGKLFKPLAFTKTFALISALIMSIVFIPPLAVTLFKMKFKMKSPEKISGIIAVTAGFILLFLTYWLFGAVVIMIGLFYLFEKKLPEVMQQNRKLLPFFAISIIGILFLAIEWHPAGIERGYFVNFLFAGILIGGLILLFKLYQKKYRPILSFCLKHKTAFLSIPLIIIFLGLLIWLGFPSFFGWLPNELKSNSLYSGLYHTFPGLGKEFMPPLDEGSFLLMPTTMPHASLGEAYDVLRKQDMIISAIPEVESSVGKLGRVESPLDPAPISMIETVITYKPEYFIDKNGNRKLFQFEPDESDYFRDIEGNVINAPDGKPYRVEGKFARGENGKLIADTSGRPFRLWRPALDPSINPGRKAWDGIRNTDSLWDLIEKSSRIPGTTAAPKLQPISARIVMLQSGIRAPMGIRIKGPDLETLESFSIKIEKILKTLPSVKSDAVTADRIIGKPYLEIVINRSAIARHGLSIDDVQQTIEYAIGGKAITTAVLGRERYPIRVRFLREFRDNIPEMENITIQTKNGYYIPLKEIASIEYVRGPQTIKSEDTFLTAYVLFDKADGLAEVSAVENVKAALEAKIQSGELVIPSGISYSFAGTYENQVRASKRLGILLPLSLFIIVLILYFKFRSFIETMIIFSGIFIAWGGGFLLIWLYGRFWFMDFSFLGINMRELFSIGPINLSVAIWVGFLALFGIASDDGVVMMTYLKSKLNGKKFQSIGELHKQVIEGAIKRVRPALMTTATTILALIPVLTSTGRGSDIMVAMAIPTFGGMLIAILTTLVTPVLYSVVKERGFNRQK